MEHAAAVEQQVTMALLLPVVGRRLLPPDKEPAHALEIASPRSNVSACKASVLEPGGLMWSQAQNSRACCLCRPLRLRQWCQSPPVFARWRYPPAPPRRARWCEPSAPWSLPTAAPSTPCQIRPWCTDRIWDDLAAPVLSWRQLCLWCPLSSYPGPNASRPKDRIWPLEKLGSSAYYWDAMMPWHGIAFGYFFRWSLHKDVHSMDSSSVLSALKQRKVFLKAAFHSSVGLCLAPHSTCHCHLCLSPFRPTW